MHFSFAGNASQTHDFSSFSRRFRRSKFSCVGLSKLLHQRDVFIGSGTRRIAGPPSLTKKMLAFFCYCLGDRRITVILGPFTGSFDRGPPNGRNSGAQRVPRNSRRRPLSPTSSVPSAEAAAGACRPGPRGRRRRPVCKTHTVSNFTAVVPNSEDTPNAMSFVHTLSFYGTSSSNDTPHASNNHRKTGKRIGVQ